MHAIGNEHMLAAFRYGWGRGVELRLTLCKSSYSGFFWEMGMYHGNYHCRYQQQSVMTLTHASLGWEKGPRQCKCGADVVVLRLRSEQVETLSDHARPGVRQG